MTHPAIASGDDTEASRSEDAGRRRIARSFGAAMMVRVIPPLLAFGLARAFLWWAAKTTGHDGFTAKAWSRWDSAHYLSIASKGYEFFSCARLPGYDPTLWCGNDAWFPGYPLMIRGIGFVTGLPHLSAAAWLSALCCLASLTLIWTAFLQAELRASHLLTLCLAAFFPGHVYMHAVFPVSLFALLLLLALWLYAERRVGWAALAAALGSFTYTSGLFMCGAIAVHALLLERETQWFSRVKDAAIVCTGVIFGFLSVLALQWAQTGVWNAFFLVQAKYAYAPRLPTSAWWGALETLVADWPRIRGPSEQTLYVAAFSVLVLFFVGWRRRRERIDNVLAAFLVVYWLTPLILGGQLSLYRAEATLLPALPLARRAPWYILAPMLFAAVVIARLMGRLFFKGAIT